MFAVVGYTIGFPTQDLNGNGDFVTFAYFLLQYKAIFNWFQLSVVVCVTSDHL